MKYEDLKVDVLLNIKQIGDLIAQSADFQLEIEELNEDTFRNWIMDIEHQLDRLDDEEEYDNDNDQHDSMLFRNCGSHFYIRGYRRNEDS